MSPSKLNSLLTGVFVALVFAFGSSVIAQDGLRLFKPYDPESFGGGRRSNDGLYSSVSGIYWMISAPRGGYIGATTVNGNEETRRIYDAAMGGFRDQINSVKINVMDTSDSLGTRFEIGNRRGHHGWLLGGYSLPGQSHQISVLEMQMVVRDNDRRFSVAGAGSVIYDPNNPGGGLGFLWGSNYVVAETAVFQDQGAAGAGQVGWVIDPVSGGYIYYTGRTEVPGSTVVNDGQSIVTPGTQLAENERWGFVPVGMTFYFPALVDSADPANIVVAPLPVWFEQADINVRSEHQSLELLYTYRAHPFTWGSLELLAGARYWGLDDDFGFTGFNTLPDRPERGLVSAFSNMSVNAEAFNRVVGPQVGMKLHRSNARWTFGAEGRLAAGVNFQTVKTDGYVSGHRDYMPIGLAARSHSNGMNSVYFGHKQHKSYVSPICEFRLSADWQWTNAVSFFGAVDAMWAGNIARGVRITDYGVSSDGTIFGLRGNDRNTDIAVYGFEVGFKIRR